MSRIRRGPDSWYQSSSIDRACSLPSLPRFVDSSRNGDFSFLRSDPQRFPSMATTPWSTPFPAFPSASYHYAAAYPPPPPGFVPDLMYAPTPVFPPPPSNHSSAYMPVTVPEYYSTVPVPTYTPGPSPIPTQIDRNQPPPAATQSHVDLHHHGPSPADHLLAQAAPQPTAAPTVSDPDGASSSSRSRKTEDDDGTTPRYGCAWQIEKSSSGLHPATPKFRCGDADSSISDDKLVHKHGPGILSMASNDSNRRFASAPSPASRMQPDRLPAALPNHASSLLLQDSEVDAFQRHSTGLCLGRFPSSSTTSKKDVAVLSHSRLDSAPEVFDEMLRPNFGHGTPVIAPGDENCCFGQQHKDVCCGTKHDDGVIPRYDRTFSSNAVHGKFRNSGGDLSKGTNTRGVSINDKRLVHKQPGPETLSMASNDTKPQQHSQVSNTARNQQFSQASTPAMLKAAEAQARAEETISKNMPRAVLDLKHRMDEHHDQSQRAIASLQGELAKLKSAASMLAVAMGMQTAESPVTGSSPGSMVTAASATSMLCAAPSSSASDSTVPAAHANVAPQVLEEMPQSYGLHNLTQRTVFRADGSEHRYYALTDTYPSERAVPEPVFTVYDDKSDGCSTESVHVFTNTPEQLTCEEEQQECEQLLKCLSKKLETEHTSACVNIISDVLELQQQDDERSCRIPVLKASDSYVTRSSKLSNAHVLRGLRWLWDPGASTPLHSSKSKLSRELSYVAISFPKVLNLSNQVGTHLQQLRDPMFSSTEAIHSPKSMSTVTTLCMILVLSFGEIAQEGRDAAAMYQVSQIHLPMRQISHIWDPGIESILVFYKWLHIQIIHLIHCSAQLPPTQIMFTIAVDATKWQCTEVYKSAIVQTLAVNFSAGRAPIFKYVIIYTDALGLRCKEVNASVLFVLAIQGSTGSYYVQTQQYN